MPSIKLTERAIERLKAPDPSGKQRLFWDSELTGFGVLVSGKTNTKSYVIQRDLPNGKSRRITIAQTNVIGLDEARERAKEILAELYAGRDPKAKRGAATLGETLDAYLAARSDLRERSATNYRDAIRLHLADWKDKPLA